MNCPISVVDVGCTRVAQARNSSIWRGDSRPVPPFRSNRTSASTPPSWNSLTQMRMVESSMNSASAIAAKDQPRSSSRMAFARRETRFSSSPSLAIATRSARSAALRKLRFVFTRRVESIPLIRSNDFRKNEESRYSTEKIYDNLDYQRAVQAYLLALPVVNQAANRAGILAMGPANTTVPIWEQLVDSRTVELTANDNTPYTWFWVDLRDGPLVIEAPPRVLGLVNDIWYHWNGDIGFTGPDRGEGGKFLLLPPGYKGDVPDGYFVVRPGSFSVWAGWRRALSE